MLKHSIYIRYRQQRRVEDLTKNIFYFIFILRRIFIYFISFWLTMRYQLQIRVSNQYTFDMRWSTGLLIL
jgi:hypothetical protein